MSQAVAIPDYIRKMFDLSFNRDLTDNVGSPMRIISIRGKVFRLKEKGEETVITGNDGHPARYIEGIIVRAAGTLSRNYYDGPWVEDSAEAPTCWSVDNVKPDISVREKQNEVCATCRHNAWGSKNVEGSKGKACSEVRRLAFVPLLDLPRLEDPDYTPCLLRVPPNSLGELKQYGETLNKAGLPYAAITTVISFDVDDTFKLTFKPNQFLPEQLAPAIRGMIDAPDTQRLLALSENDIRVPAALEGGKAQEQITQVKEEPQQVKEPEPAPAPAPKAKPAAAKAKPAAAKPATTAAPVSNLGSGALAGLMGTLKVPGLATSPQQVQEPQTIEGTAEEATEEETGEDVNEPTTMTASSGLSALVANALNAQ